MASGTLVRRVLLQIKADDGDTEEKLDKIALKADELSAKHPDLKVRIDTAAASAKVAVLREELKGLSRQADEEAAKGGILSRLLGGNFGASFTGGFGKIFSAIPGLPGGEGASAAGEGGSSLLGSGVGMGAGIAVAIPAIAALLVEVDGLASGFAAAGAGAGAFYLLARPAISNLTSDYKALNSAQQAYQQAQNVAAIDPTKAHLTAEHNALVKLEAVRRGMTADEATAAGGVARLSAEYHKLTAAFQPEAFKVFSGVLTLANQVLPDVAPFAKTFADALTGLLKQASHFAGSKGFSDWLHQFQKLEGPSITAIGVGIGHVTANIGKLFTIMSAKDVTNAINIAFSIIDGAVLALGWTLRTSMHWWDKFTSATDHARADIEWDAHNIAHWWDSLRHSAANLAHDVAVWFDRIRHDIAQWAGDVRHDADLVVGWFERLPGRIVSALGNLAGMLFQAGVNAIQGLISGFGSMVGSAMNTVGGWAHDIVNAIGSPFGIHFSEPSEAVQMIKAGRNVALGLGMGMEQGTAAAHASAQRMSGAVAGGITAGGGAAHGGRGAALQIEWVGGSGADQEFITFLKKHIRIRGGNPAVIGL